MMATTGEQQNVLQNVALCCAVLVLPQTAEAVQKLAEREAAAESSFGTHTDNAEIQKPRLNILLKSSR